MVGWIAIHLPTYSYLDTCPLSPWALALLTLSLGWGGGACVATRRLTSHKSAVSAGTEPLTRRPFSELSLVSIAIVSMAIVSTAIVREGPFIEPRVDIDMSAPVK